MILALEGRYDAAPRGIGVPLDYIENLRQWAPHHGFRLSGLRSFDRSITEADWHRVEVARALGAQPDQPYPTMSRAQT
jgi:hypothetical protein